MKLSTIKHKRFYAGVLGIGLLLLSLWMWAGGLGINKNKEREIIAETVIVSQRSDPYYSLAQKIAQTEKLEIVEELADVLKLSPKFIILVASPENITAERLLEIGLVFLRSDYYPGLGIISGSSLELAEQLWLRKDLAQAGSNYIGGDTEVSQLVYEPAIFNISDGTSEKIALNKETLVDVLKKADYIYWTRHTGARTWFWNSESENWGENDELFSKDIPQLKPAVIYSPTCSVFRPWVENSIAIGFVDKGAAAFLGFANSPHTNAFLKRGLSVPGISSWDEFPVGLVAQVGNKAATGTLFKVPQFFMLGDPRTYLSKDPPYRIVSDTLENHGKRVIEGESAVNGVLAIKIENGAKFDFLSFKGVTSHSENDVFYNSKVQTLNLGADKYVLYLHNGGDFQIELSTKAPFGWRMTDALVDAFDYSWVVLWLNVQADDNPFLYTVPIPIFIIILFVKVLPQKKSIRDYRSIFIFALSLALIRLVCFLLRKDVYTISANYLDYTALQFALGCAGVFSSVAGGLMLMRDMSRKTVKALGLMFAVMRQFWLAVFYLVFTTFLNILTPVTGMTAPWLLNYDVFWLSFIVLFFEISMILAFYRYAIHSTS